MQTETYNIITKIAHTKEQVRLIQGYVGTGKDEIDFKQPIHINTLVAWVSTPSMIRLRLRDFINCEELAVSKEFGDWKERCEDCFDTMQKYVPAQEVDDFIDLVGNFIRVAFYMETHRDE